MFGRVVGHTWRIGGRYPSPEWSLLSYSVTNPSLDEIVARIQAAEPRAGRTRVVAIDGRAGSGKSTLAAALVDRLDAATIHMDDIFPGWDGLAAAAPLLTEQVLEPLLNGRPAKYRRYDWEQGAYAEWVAVEAHPVLIVEGCASGSLVAAPYLSLLIWIDAPVDVRMDRGITRDGETFRPHWQRWAGQEDVHFATERTAERADVTIDGRSPVPPHPAGS
jgi:uridine kinase